jgi:hypothetical protein
VLHLSRVSPAAVCYEAAVAAYLTEAGTDVVLCGVDGAELTAAMHQGRGRLAIFVGDPATDREVALAMARELFGGVAVFVATMAEAGNLTRLPGSEPTSSGTVDDLP